MPISAPLELHTSTVLPEWIDYNGHMNVAYYVLAFDHVTDAFLDYIGLDHGYKAKVNVTTFVADMNVTSASSSPTRAPTRSFRPGVAEALRPDRQARIG
jgi:acyl-CoA thioester hydrolase